VIDIDLDSFFDRVNHDRLMRRLGERIRDKRILRLIGRYLRAGILEHGLVTLPLEGTPQGGPLSPLLSNVVLDELDKELELRGHRFVRYADDCNIYVRTKRAGKRVMSGVSEFIEKKLKLKVNVSKSAVARPHERKFLGFTITEDEGKVRISKEAIARFKNRVRELTCRQNRELETQVSVLSRYLQGWIGYYCRSEADQEIGSLDKWVRRRLRVLHLKRWRSPGTRYREFERLGMKRIDCKFISHTTKRYWFLSGTRALNFTLNLQYFRKLGLYFMLDRYAL
jgi:RNA-directed DNA polymerase